MNMIEKVFDNEVMKFVKEINDCADITLIGKINFILASQQPPAMKFHMMTALTENFYHPPCYKDNNFTEKVTLLLTDTLTNGGEDLVSKIDYIESTSYAPYFKYQAIVDIMEVYFKEGLL